MTTSQITSNSFTVLSTDEEGKSWLFDFEIYFQTLWQLENDKDYHQNVGDLSLVVQVILIWPCLTIIDVCRVDDK